MTNIIKWREPNCGNCKWHIQARRTTENNKLCVYEPPKLAIHGESFPIVQDWMRCRFHEFEIPHDPEASVK